MAFRFEKMHVEVGGAGGPSVGSFGNSLPSEVPMLKTQEFWVRSVKRVPQRIFMFAGGQPRLIMGGFVR